MTGCLLDVGVFDLQMQYTVDKQESFVKSCTFILVMIEQLDMWVGGCACQIAVYGQNNSSAISPLRSTIQTVGRINYGISLKQFGLLLLHLRFGI